MLQLRTSQDDWKIPIHKTIANQDKGIHELFIAINKHSKYLNESGLLERKKYSRIKELIEQIVRERLENNFWNDNRKKILDDNLEEIISHKRSLYALIQDLHNTD
jgi:LAO/AO transport system kinase